MYIKKLGLENFKKVRGLDIEFGNELTTIAGENGTGKSTIMDAFMWVLFGKDSHDRANFEVQTLDENNNVIHGLVHSVTAYLDANGTERVLKRTLEERWVKPNGKAEKELKGTTTKYEIDGIPVKQKDFQAAIGELIDENIFKMVTNPLYFSNLKWDKQREILLDIIGDISEENVINYNNELAPLSKLLTDGIDNFNKRTKASIAKLKDQVKSIPYRIDECNNSIVEADFGELELKKAHIQSEINGIDEQIADASKANDGKLKLQDELYKAKEELSTKINEALRNVNKPLEEASSRFNTANHNYMNHSNEIMMKESNKKNKENQLSRLNKELEDTNAERVDLLNKYHSIDDRLFEFDTDAAKCPACGREYDLDKIEEIKANAENHFRHIKESSLESVKKLGLSISNKIKTLEANISSVEKEIAELDKEIVELKNKDAELKEKVEFLQNERDSLSITKEVHFEGEDDLKTKIDELKIQIDQFQEADNSELKAKKRTLQEELEDVTKTLGKKDTNAELKKRMEELNQEEKDLQVKIADLEGKQYLGEQFIRTKVELLEDSINKKFKGVVTFKLFNQQVNGGLNETCEALINGVPFSDANTASKINAGLSIINTLCEHYNISAPIFVDNAEAVNELNKTNSQLIKLIVSLDKQLKVEVDK